MRKLQWGASRGVICFRIVTDGEPGAWIESEHTSRRAFMRDLREWWGGDAEEVPPEIEATS